MCVQSLAELCERRQSQLDELTALEAIFDGVMMLISTMLTSFGNAFDNDSNHDKNRNGIQNSDYNVYNSELTPSFNYLNHPSIDTNFNMTDSGTSACINMNSQHM